MYKGCFYGAPLSQRELLVQNTEFYFSTRSSISLTEPLKKRKGMYLVDKLMVLTFNIYFEFDSILEVRH